MAYVILQVALTVDGYIARKNGSVDFLTPMGSAFTQRFIDFVSSIDVMVMGNST